MPDEKLLHREFKSFEKTKEEILLIQPFRKGSITKRWMTCGNLRCKCRKEKRNKHGPYYWWTTKEKGKTRAILLPKELLAEARAYIKNYKLLQRKIDRLSKLSERIIMKKVENFRKSLKHKA